MVEAFARHLGGWRAAARTARHRYKIDQKAARMAALIDDPVHWLGRAEETRAIAEDMRDAESKRIMLGIADDYDKLAKRAQERRSREKHGTS